MNTIQAHRDEQIDASLDGPRRRLATHPLYREIRSIGDLRIFLETHVFAVWDFMSLLKSLQSALTCVTVPWLPSPYPTTRRLINEIVLGEESDEYKGRFLSHFELYVEAMRQVGANTGPIEKLISRLEAGSTVTEALATTAMPDEAKRFVQMTFDVISSNQPHLTAAVFTFGREDLIPEMFSGIIRDLGWEAREIESFVYYLERHIEVDGETHGPLALKMVSELCGDSDAKWHDAMGAAKASLQERIRLWDAVVERIEVSR